MENDFVTESLKNWQIILFPESWDVRRWIPVTLWQGSPSSPWKRTQAPSAQPPLTASPDPQRSQQRGSQHLEVALPTPYHSLSHMRCGSWAGRTRPSLNCRSVSKMTDCCCLKPLCRGVVCGKAIDDKQEHVIIFADFLLSSREDRRLGSVRVFIIRFRHFQRENPPRRFLPVNKHRTPW